MPITPPYHEPASLTAGDTLLFYRNFSDYPYTSGWTLTYAFLREGGEDNFTFQATAPDSSGNGFSINVASNVTQGWAPGWYSGQASVSLAGQIFTVWHGRLQIVADIAQSNSQDLRSHARRVLDNIKAVLENRATQSIAESNVEGLMLRKIPLAELIKLFDKYTELVRAEDNAERLRNGLGTSRKVLTRFKGGGGGRGGFEYKAWLE